MARTRDFDDLSASDLQQLLIEKRQANRRTRLEYFRRTGRLIVVEPEAGPARLEAMRSESLSADGSEENDAPAPRRRSHLRRARRSWWDRMLLLVELGAVLGLAFIIYTGFNILSTLNQEVASVLVQPTLTPTAIIQAVVLPSGHTPPNAQGNAVFNEAEIPEHLRPLVQSMANVVLPTAGPQQAVRMQIPAIKVDHPVVQGDSWEQLRKGIGQHQGTPNPGQKGNLVFSAHNDIFGQIFRDLDQLKVGDSVVVFTAARTYRYVVRQTRIVEPTAIEVMAASTDPIITLISCYPYRVDNKRIVVTAALQETP